MTQTAEEAVATKCLVHGAALDLLSPEKEG
jgi:hypothetical protein